MMTTAAACLAMAIYHEARGEPLDAQKAIAEVVLTRAAHPDYPNTVCEVVTEHRTPVSRPWACQFSFYCDGESDAPTDKTAWAVAQQVANEVLSGDILGIGATHYHTVEVSPVWRHDLTPLGRLGDHVFYRTGCHLPACSPRPPLRPGTIKTPTTPAGDKHD